MPYRSDIDGLRAVAVVPVLFYHAGLPAFSGGYIGVDIFFVISGFLITSVLREEIRHDRFSVLAFYERRIRRIFPALFAMAAVATILAIALFLPRALRDFGATLATTTLFVSNVYFWRTIDYFHGTGELNPLLHTWSLAVEEQFYIVFPLFLAVTMRFWRSGLVPLTAALTLLSFALSAVALARSPTGTFFLAPPRAWELLLGSLLALEAVPSLRARWLREAAAVLGLAAILWAVFSFSTLTPFPGPNALLPCLGAALLIHVGSGGGSLVTTGLGTRPLVAVGLISYSLYLWHWPLLVFARYVAIRDLTAAESAVLLAASFVVATLSWRFVESPFRRGRGDARRPAVFIGAATVMTLFVVVGVAADRTNGWPGRVDPEVARLDAFGAIPTDLTRCSDPSAADVRAERLCRVGRAGSTVPDWLVWGDSHALALSGVLSDWLAARGATGVLASSGACVPLFGVTGLGLSRTCSDFNAAVATLIEGGDIRNVVIVSLWTPYLDALLADSQSRERSRAESERVLDRNIDATFARLRALGVRILVMDPVPGARFDVPTALARARRFNRPLELVYSHAEYLSRNAVLLQALARNRGELYAEFAPEDLLCAAGPCRVTENDVPIYFDNNHPSPSTHALWLSALSDTLRYGSGHGTPEPP